MASRALFRLSFVLLLGGCGKSGGESSSTPSLGSAPAIGLSETPRRPAKTWFMIRGRDRCDVYAQIGDDLSPPLAGRCPADLEVGERARLMGGKTCMRENTTPDRAGPMLCPEFLVKTYEHDLRDGG